MIGRTLDAMLSFVEDVALAGVGSNSLIGRIASDLKYFALPIKKLEYPSLQSRNTCLHNRGWKIYDINEKPTRRLLAKAFEKRRKVDIGEKFVLKKAKRVGCGFGHYTGDYEVKRLDKNIVSVRRVQEGIGLWGAPEDFIVSSEKEKLSDYENLGLTPVHYQGVIF